MSRDHAHDYTLEFGPILNSDGTIRFVNHHSGEEHCIGFYIDDQELGIRAQSSLPTVIADLIDLAVAIYASDRLAPQNPRKKQHRLLVNLPVRNPELLNSGALQTQLTSLLEWATGSRWIFNFRQRNEIERCAEHPSFPVAEKGCEVALWSGGLDALAGLYNRLNTQPQRSFVLFGTGSNNTVHHRQGKVAEELQSIFPGRFNLYRLPIRFSKSRRHRKNKVSRARGVVFMMLGAACAYLMGSRRLCVYENGIGAINLPYRKSSIGLDQTRSVHPLTLLRVSKLITTLIQEDFHIHNPFLFWTKAEMCKALAEDRRDRLASLTKSCDSPHRKRPNQCGYCSSCILRKQALVASRVNDQTQYVVPHGSQPVEDTHIHLQHMLAQVLTIENLLKGSESLDSQWIALARRFPRMDDIVDRCAVREALESAKMRASLLHLYRTYVNEWNIVKSQLEWSLSNRISPQQLSNAYLVETR